MTQPMAVEALETRAAMQRRELHHSMEELRSSVRETLDMKHQVREHFATSAGAAAVLGLVAGYAFMGLFRD